MLYSFLKIIFSLYIALPATYFNIQAPATAKDPVINSIIYNVPFVSQAPSGNWKDPRQQDSCEEASVYMAMKWINNETINKKIAENDMLAISDWENKIYGNYHDTSASDTADRLIKNYYEYNNFEVKNNINYKNIIKELNNGNLIITPVDGRKLNNPNYTAPGPDRHMILIVGYDTLKKEFITNDPGTRMGNKYRYDEKIFENAIMDYPTGKKVEIKEINKSMIIIRPKK